MKGQIRSNKAWLVVLELLIFGFFNSLLRVGSILTLLRLDTFFTSESQLLYLLPAATCILFILVAVSIAESQCHNYIAKLDKRLEYINTIMPGNRRLAPKKYLQRIFLPLVISLPATPLIACFLAVSTPWLFAALIANVAINTITIHKYNRKERTESERFKGISVTRSKSESEIHCLETNSRMMLIPAYLLRDQSGGNSYISEEHAIGYAINDSSEDNQIRKRKDLGAIQTIFHGVFLAVSAILALLRLSSIGNLVGFFILSGTVRRSFIALAEYWYFKNERISIEMSYKLLQTALTSQEVIMELLQETYDEKRKVVQQFNTRYKPLLSAKLALRLKNVSVINSHDGPLINRVSGRIELSSSTIIRISSARTAQALRDLIQQNERGLLEGFIVSGQIFCAGQELGLSFLNNLPVRAPWKIRVTSTRMEAAFNPSQTNRVTQLIYEYGLDTMLFDGDQYIADISRLSKRQLQRLRCLVCLIMVLVEPTCLSIGAFVLEPFDAKEIVALIDMIRIESENHEIYNLLLTRKPIDELMANPRYELTNSNLQRIHK